MNRPRSETLPCSRIARDKVKGTVRDAGPVTVTQSAARVTVTAQAAPKGDGVARVMVKALRAEHATVKVRVTATACDVAHAIAKAPRADHVRVGVPHMVRVDRAMAQEDRSLKSAFP